MRQNSGQQELLRHLPGKEQAYEPDPPTAKGWNPLGCASQQEGKTAAFMNTSPLANESPEPKQ